MVSVIETDASVSGGELCAVKLNAGGCKTDPVVGRGNRRVLIHASESDPLTSVDIDVTPDRVKQAIKGQCITGI